MAERPARIRRESSVALYMQIASALAGEIERHRFKPSGRLPAEQELMKRYGVSRITVRQAIARLILQGLVVSKQGKGTFVAGPVVQHQLEGLQGFYDALVGQGHVPRTRLLEFGPRRAPADIAPLLAAQDSRDPVYLERSYVLDDRPFALARAWLPAAAKRVSWEQAERYPLYAILQDILGEKVARAELGIVARSADPEESRLLELPAGSPVLVLERISYGPADQALEISRFSIRPENYRFRLGVQGPIAVTRQIEEVEAAPARRPARGKAGTESRTRKRKES
jgi:GntR family transcriptional regulator